MGNRYTRFQPHSGLSTLPFEGEEEEEEGDDVPQGSSPTHNISGSNALRSSIGGFSFTEDHSIFYTATLILLHP